MKNDEVGEASCLCKMSCLLYAAREGCHARHASRLFVAFSALLLVVLTLPVQALPRAFSTCDTLADALNNSILHSLSPAVLVFCRVTSGTFKSFFGEEGDDESTIVIVDGEEVAAADLWAYESTNTLCCCLAS